MNPYVKAVVNHLKEKAVLLDEKMLGEDFMFRCPFHHGESQNFGINSQTGKWNCFKCKQRGRNVGDLLNRLGLGSTGLTPGQFYSFVDVRLELLKAFEVDVKDFSGQREAASATLPVTCELHEAPQALDYIRGRGLDASMLTAAGVLYSPYGEYGRRIIMPWSYESRVVGFSARSIDNHEYVRKMLRPKDVHQDIFLYNPTGRSFKGASVAITEGEFSAWAASHIGLHGASVFGSYLHPGQVNVLTQAAEAVILFDGDDAGREGAVKAYERLVGFVPRVRICALPSGQDPADLYLRDPEELRACLRQTHSVPDILALIKAKM